MHAYLCVPHDEDITDKSSQPLSHFNTLKKELKMSLPSVEVERNK